MTEIGQEAHYVPDVTAGKYKLTSANASRLAYPGGTVKRGVWAPCGFSCLHTVEFLNAMNPVNPYPATLIAPAHTLYCGVTRGHATDINCWNQGQLCGFEICRKGGVLQTQLEAKHSVG